MIWWIAAALFGACTIGFIFGYMVAYTIGWEDGTENERFIRGQIHNREER